MVVPRSWRFSSELLHGSPSMKAHGSDWESNRDLVDYTLDRRPNKVLIRRWHKIKHYTEFCLKKTLFAQSNVATRLVDTWRACRPCHGETYAYHSTMHPLSQPAIEGGSRIILANLVYAVDLPSAFIYAVARCRCARILAKIRIFHLEDSIESIRLAAWLQKVKLVVSFLLAIDPPYFAVRQAIFATIG